jgi:uncharacterized repeat protein (TIGR01451 family)
MAAHATPRPRRWALLTLLAILGLQLQVLTALPASAAVCSAAFNGSPDGSLAISATVPDGGTIQAGQSITITITWDTGDWTDLDQFHSCFQLNGADVNSLNFEEIPPDNDGIIVHTITVPNNVSDGDELCSRSRLSGQPTGGTSTQKSNKLCWTVGPGTPGEPDVKVSKSSSATNVVAGDSFDYTLTAENVGNADADNVEITDDIPNSLTVTAKPGNCSGSDPITCTLGTLTPGQSKSVTFTVQTSDGSCPKVDNVGTVSASNEPNANKGNNTSNTVTVNVSCPEPDVKVSKSASTATVNAGGSVTFTITAENVGDGTATNVQIVDALPSSVTITSAPGCAIVGQTVTCAVGDLAKNATATVSITVQTSEASCPQITNFATVSAANEPNANTGNNASNTVTVGVVCPDPDVEIRKSSDAPVTGLAPGDTFTYRVTVENVGGADATGVQIVDVVPNGLTIVSAPGCHVTGQTVTCDIGTLAAGAQTSVEITVEATEDACPEVTNTATVSAPNEPGGNTGNNTSDPVTDIVVCTEPGIAIRITKTNDANNDGIYTDSEESKRSGLDVPFRLVITNTGEETVRITDLTDSFDQTVLDLLDAKCAKLAGATLDPGESVVCEFTLNNYSPPEDTVLENMVEVCVKMVGGDRTDCDRDPSRVRSAVVLGRTITKTPPGGTAFTGADGGTVRFGLLAMALLLLGTGIVYAGYRRRQSYDG